MSVIEIILRVMVGLLYAKWVVLAVLLPFMAIDGHNRSRSVGLKLLSAPYLVVNKLTRGGWVRYALYQVGMIPSVGLRMWIYRCFGARIGKYAIVHFRTKYASRTVWLSDVEASSAIMCSSTRETG